MCKSLFTTLNVESVIISPATTSQGPLAFIDNFLFSLSSDFKQTCFKFKIKSVTFSVTPGIVENSCATPSILIVSIAYPGKEESNILLNELPSVIPNPLSRGYTSNLA